jgi:SRSO17 transposase
LSYVLAVPANQWVWTTGPKGPAQAHAKTVAAAIAPQAFKRISAAPGAKGPRVHAWARTVLHPDPGDGTTAWLLVRRSVSDPTETAYYLARAPAAATLTELAHIAGTRWAIEETFQSAKGEVGLDHYQVRRYDSWYRHITLAMLAHAFLTVSRATAAKKGHHPTSTTN